MDCLLLFDSVASPLSQDDKLRCWFHEDEVKANFNINLSVKIDNQFPALSKIKKKYTIVFLRQCEE